MLRVLIADDEPIELMILYRKLRKLYEGQMEIYQAENGRCAVDLFLKYHCQIVILDIEMPGINGLDAAEMIRKSDSQCIIIFMTAFDEFTYAKRAISIRAFDYLLKPGTEEELAAALDEAVRLCQEQNQETVKTFQYKGAEIKPLGEIRSAEFKRIVSNFIHENYMFDVSLQDAARIFNYTEVYFCRLFKQCFYKSFTAYLTEYRIEKAKSLLEDIRSNVKEISSRVGYRDSNYFTKVFKRYAGVTPSEYRTVILENTQNHL